MVLIVLRKKNLRNYSVEFSLKVEDHQVGDSELDERLQMVLPSVLESIINQPARPF
jgi:hypothetical protein